MNLTGAARIAGIMGWPVSQAFSPRLHGFWLNELGIDGALVPLPVKPEDFSTVVRGLMKAGFKGSSVTIPHKEAAFALAHTLDLAAHAAGAVNLLIFHEDGRIEGRNTDATGLAASLRENLGADFTRSKPAVLLGAGGAARAGVVALHDLGASEIRILNRTRSRAEQLAAALAKEVSPKLLVLDDSEWAKAASGSAIVIHTTSAGMKGAPSLSLNLSALPKDAAVCDIVYTPLETPLLRSARTAGLRTVDGLGMLMHQGVPAFEAFFGVRPTVTPALRAHLEEALRGR
ncbi:MAG: shikimate dehydrogenase [Alphaproteobacteria bacterium]|nr:shikimate dehydrogenase [Alphaproteobacteria bacterium]MBL6938992.1 shikimate dehydrogenase [Alphaproteobacteria bacterium]MBL7099584.1 shikimate dehydrogenase [Alphaproteobacteria bacterium]